MPKLTPISWKEFDKFLGYIGCRLKREKGDHRIYSREGLLRPIVIPEVKDYRSLLSETTSEHWGSQLKSI